MDCDGADADDGVAGVAGEAGGGGMVERRGVDVDGGGGMFDVALAVGVLLSPVPRSAARSSSADQA